MINVTPRGTGKFNFVKRNVAPVQGAEKNALLASLETQEGIFERVDWKNIRKKKYQRIAVKMK